MVVPVQYYLALSVALFALGVIGVLIRRNALLEVGGFRSRWPYSMDWEVWFKLAARYPVAIAS